MKSSSAVITRQSAILREGGGSTAENVEVNDLFSGRSFGKLKANGESIPNTYSLTSLPTGNEAGESFHHALGFSVAMRFERFDDLYLADATVLENDETEQDDPLHTVSYRLFGIFGLAGYVGEQCGFATGEKRQLLGDGAHLRASFFLFDGKPLLFTLVVLRTQCRCHGHQNCYKEEMSQHSSSNLGDSWGIWVLTRDKVSNNCFNLKTYAAFFSCESGGKSKSARRGNRRADRKCIRSSAY